MRLIRLAVERWQISLIVFGLCALLGLHGYLTIPRSVDPHYPVPTVVIAALQPGADAIDMEQTVARPIEDVLQGLDDVRDIRSRSSDGSSYITIDFFWSTDPDDRYNDVVREITALRPELPSTLSRIEFRKVRLTEAAVLQLALVSEGASARRLEKYAEDLRDRLNVVPGVRQTRIYGLARPEVQVEVDGDRLATLGIPLTLVADALRDAGADIAAGTVHAGTQRYNIEAGGAFESLQEVGEVALRANDGGVVRVADIATVTWGQPERQHVTRFNGKEALFITVKQKDGTNVMDVSASVAEALMNFEAQLPPDIHVEVGFDQSADVRSKLGRLGTDFAIALALVLLTLLPLGWRAALVVATSIPLSLAIALATLNLLGHSLNQLAIAGFILALGLLVDDSIVVTENIARHLRTGVRREAAAIAGAAEIALPVLGCTGVLLFAFLPLLFLPEAAGNFTRPLPLAVILSVAASLAVSLLLVPFLASRILPRSVGPHGNRLLRAIDRGIKVAYAPVLERSLARPWRTVIVATLVCLGAFALAPGLGFRLFPVADVPQFLVEVETPQGTGVEGTDAAVRFAASVLAAEPSVVTRLENAGRGNPQVFYNVREDVERPNFGNILAVLDSWDTGETTRLFARLRKRFDAYPNARIILRPFENGVPIEAPVAVRVSGPDLSELKRLAGEVEAILTATPGARDIRNPLAIDRTDLALGLDHGKAAVAGVAGGEPRRTLSLAIAGERVARLRDSEGDSFDVVVSLPMEERQEISALDRIYVASTTGAVLPLRQIATPRYERVAPEVSRYKLQRSVTVNAQVAEGYLASAVNAEAAKRLSAVMLPVGYALSFGGEAEASARSTGGLGGIVLVSLFGILAVLVIEFGRFREVAVVGSVIPLGLVGGFVALRLAGQPLSYMAIIGFVALIGIEIKNSILLVDFTTRLREQGMGLEEAVRRAGEVRFLPVLLTSVTAIGGLMPLALSGLALYTSLAWVVIGGLISSTIFSRVVVPAVYLLVARSDRQA